MAVHIRRATLDDAEACGRICYEGFAALNQRHGFPPNFPNLQAATERMSRFIAHPAIFGIVAEDAGRVVGINFMSERDPIRGVGPIVVDPAAQGRGIGRRLMTAALERAADARGVRLLQDGFNMLSLTLYAGLGFVVRDLVVAMIGTPTAQPPTDVEVRPMGAADLPACAALHERVHGYSRTNELADALAADTPVVALRNGRVAAYLAVPGLWLANHGVGATAADLAAAIAGAVRLTGEPVSLLVPAEDAELFGWCVAQKFRAIKPMTLMTRGDYRRPAGSFVPSVLY